MNKIDKMCKRFSFVVSEAVLGNIRPFILTLWKDADDYITDREMAYFSVLFFITMVSSTVILSYFKPF